MHSGTVRRAVTCRRHAGTPGFCSKAFSTQSRMLHIVSMAACAQTYFMASGRMPPNAPEAAHYKLQLVALQREVDKGKGNSMLYSAYLQVLLSTGCMRRVTSVGVRCGAAVRCVIARYLPNLLALSSAGPRGAQQRAVLPAAARDVADAHREPSHSRHGGAAATPAAHARAVRVCLTAGEHFQLRPLPC